MLTVEYHRDGETVADHWAESFVWAKVKEHNDYGDMSVVIANGLVIDTFRALINEGKINHEQIRFLFNGKYLHPDKNGRISNWPVGFCDCIDDVLDRLLGLNS